MDHAAYEARVRRLESLADFAQTVTESVQGAAAIFGF